MNTQKIKRNYLKVSPDLELYYVEAGSGQPIVFIPGWCGITEYYERYQIPYFACNYRALTFDPRSQGRSSKTLENNNYLQHGKDLKAFIDALSLKDVTLVAVSSGCLDIYAYLRIYGMENLKSIVFIDYMTKPIAAEKGDWAEFSDAMEVGDFINAVIHNFRDLLIDFVPTMFERNMTSDELDWLVDHLLKTPRYAAALLGVDSSFSDYTEELRQIDGSIPVLNVVSNWHEGWAEAAQKLLKKNAPNSEIFVLGKHLMFLEFPDEFNKALETFLSKNK